MKKTQILTIVILFTFSLSNLKAQTTGTFEDSRDGKIYKTIQIGKQVWFAENLAFKADSGSWAYDNDNDNVEKYGYLYNWKTAQNVCPDGWHLPTKLEFETLLDNNGGISNKKANYTALIPSGNSGFLTIFAGWRTYGVCSEKDKEAYFWSASDFNKTNMELAWFLCILSRDKEAKMVNNFQYLEFSIRCIRD